MKPGDIYITATYQQTVSHDQPFITDPSGTPVAVGDTNRFHTRFEVWGPFDTEKAASERMDKVFHEVRGSGQHGHSFAFLRQTETGLVPFNLRKFGEALERYTIVFAEDDKMSHLFPFTEVKTTTGPAFVLQLKPGYTLVIDQGERTIVAVHPQVSYWPSYVGGHKDDKNPLVVAVLSTLRDLLAAGKSVTWYKPFTALKKTPPWLNVLATDGGDQVYNNAVSWAETRFLLTVTYSHEHGGKVLSLTEQGLKFIG